MAGNGVLEPLSLAKEVGDSASGSSNKSDELEQRVICLFCDQEYDLLKERDAFLGHMVIKHKLVIADVKFIADLKEYTNHWREKFRDKEITEFCSVIEINSKPTDTGPREQYYLLCDALPEDKQLREGMQKHKLQEVLEAQCKERDSSNFCRACLFCKVKYKGNRSDLFDHMAKEHSFNVGRPDNLVFTDELLDLLQSKLDNIQCLYCERTFKDRQTLVAHMRKKNHKRINPKNTAYDKFYIINYLELGKNWKAIQSEDEKEIEESDNDDWNDWQEEGGAKVVCLFCTHSYTETEQLLAHMAEEHNFNLTEVKESLGLSFYRQVKLVNYVRRQLHLNACSFCETKFPTREELLSHMNTEGHMGKIPDMSVWDQAQYYFPTFEDDNLLYCLEDAECDDSTGDGSTGKDGGVVIPEDPPVKESILAEESVRKDLLT